jgi:hypothetical protein
MNSNELSEYIVQADAPYSGKPLPVEFVRVSKHRAGRTPPLSPRTRKRRDSAGRRAEQASKSRTEDAKALARG